MSGAKLISHQLNKRILFIIISIFIISSLLVIWSSSRGVKVQGVSFKSNGLNIVGHIYLPSGEGPFPAIILSHGSNVQGHNLFLYRQMCKRFAKRGYFVSSFDYRGYGDSEDPSKIETADDLDFTQDLVSATSFLLQKYGKGISDITLVGHSFGGGIGIAAGVKDKRVKRIVAIAPGRRFKERFLEPGAPEGEEWLQRRLIKDMRLKEPIPLGIIEEFTLPVLIGTYVEHYFDKPILLIDGSLEGEKDREFLKNIFERMKGNKSYIIMEGADHYFGTKKFGTVKDPEILEELINVIDTWIKKN